MLTTSSLDELLTRFLAGERQLLDEIARRCEPVLLRWIQRLLSRRTRRTTWRTQLDSREICQRVYLQLWEQASQPPLAIVENPWGYLARTVHNAVENELRWITAQRRDIRRRHKNELDLGDVPGAVMHPEEQMEHRELLEQVTQSMNHRERQIWTLVQSGLDWIEIGRRLGVGARAARMRYHRTIERLKRVVAKRDSTCPSQGTCQASPARTNRCRRSRKTG